MFRKYFFVISEKEDTALAELQHVVWFSHSPLTYSATGHHHWKTTKTETHGNETVVKQSCTLTLYAAILGTNQKKKQFSSSIPNPHYCSDGTHHIAQGYSVKVPKGPVIIFPSQRRTGQ